MVVAVVQILRKDNIAIKKMESSTFPLKRVYRAKDTHIFFTRFHLFLCAPQLLEIRLPAGDYCFTMNTLSTIPEAKVPQASDHA